MQRIRFQSGIKPGYKTDKRQGEGGTLTLVSIMIHKIWKKIKLSATLEGKSSSFGVNLKVKRLGEGGTQTFDDLILLHVLGICKG